ncbi:DUF624 domain-containing protein [Ruania alkalisoli]|uniref:DUF624 domain-containing protein n=1 Tax=Ruania alkalisoli TaxID=2779775 RepID=A0A7M1SUZ8_9MICO|nr:DUF624 domain-containing protein [Ruania alkalisoli]QOR70897.1 DUF624 domain-containing protein [Ruania alkalisoli]
MHHLLDWHQRIGRLGLRLLCLHLLWMAWTLRGGVLAGIFPATAALHGVLRDDIRHALHYPGEPLGLDRAGRRALRTRFAGLWRAEFGPANGLGAVLTVAWALVIVDRIVVGTLDLGGLGPVLAGGLTVAGAVLGVLTVLVWPLQAHFDDGAFALLRRSAVLAGGRPATAALAALGVGVILCAYYVIPGLIPVLGVAAPAALATSALWRTGVLAAPPSTPHAGTTPHGKDPIGQSDRNERTGRTLQHA